MDLTLDKNLRFLVAKNKIKIADLAKETGLPYSTCHDAVYGAEVTRPINIAKLARFFNVSMEEIMFSDLKNKEECTNV